MNLLEVISLNKSFGGLHVTNNVNLHVTQGELASIIGPNGAGKSTLFNQMTGYFRPDSGSILFNGQSIVGKTPNDIVRLGIGRAFQRSNIFPRLSVYENVQVAVISKYHQALNLWRSIGRMGEINTRTEEIMQNVGLLDKHRYQAGKLALGDQKRLEIALALALEPRLLLLDEPTAGMSPEETHATVSLVERLVHEFNVTLLFTEHDIGLVFSLSQRIYVLNYGMIIAEGLPQDIAKNERVQEVYLGSPQGKVNVKPVQTAGK